MLTKRELPLEVSTARDACGRVMERTLHVLGQATISSDDIIHQMSAILRSPQFRHSVLLRRLFRFVVEETLQGGGDTLDAARIARRVFGKGSEFRSSKDSSVRVATNRLRTALQLYYAYHGAEHEFVIEMKPGSYRPNIVLGRSRPI